MPAGRPFYVTDRMRDWVDARNPAPARAPFLVDIAYSRQALMESPPQLISPEALISKLDSYSSNIARTRKLRKLASSTERKRPNHQLSVQETHSFSSNPFLSSDENNSAFINAVQSLYFTLRNQQAAMTLILEANERCQNVPIAFNIKDQLASSLLATLIQAIRGAADIGDYALILRLVLDAVIPFATAFSILYASPILHPRVFGEALVGLGQRTQCSTSKLKKLWNALLSTWSHPSNLLSAQPSAQELTAIMSGLARRGKIKAAIQLFYSHLNSTSYHTMTMHYTHDMEGERLVHSNHSIQPDAYTVTELLRILVDSIQEPNTIPFGNSDTSSSSLTLVVSQKTHEHNPSKDTSTFKTNHNTNDDQDDSHDDNDDDMDLDFGVFSKQQQVDNDASSPCWQWRETEALLNVIEEQHRYTLSDSTSFEPADLHRDTNPEQVQNHSRNILLNNHVYSAALKVNERAQALYGIHKHKGAQFARNIFHRMKVREFVLLFVCEIHVSSGGSILFFLKRRSAMYREPIYLRMSSL